MGIFKLAFVDSVAAAPTLRLNLANPPWTALPGTDFGYPPMLYAVAGTLLVDGQVIPNAVHGNRDITLKLNLITSDPDTTATWLQQLHRELDRPRNLLMYQLGTAPVFFRTYRAVPGSIVVFTDGDIVRVEAVIPAEPYGYGLRQTLSTKTIIANPATESNVTLDIAGNLVIGDVPTPAYVHWDHAATPFGAPLVGVRARGTPASLPWFAQAEAFTMGGADTTVQSNDANASGAGNNNVLTTFATTATMAHRLSPSSGTDTFPPGVSETDAHRAEWPGVYRVYVRVRRNVVSGTSAINLRYATEDMGSGPSVPLPTGGAFKIVDLDLLEVGGSQRGYDGASFPARGPIVYLDAERVGGTDTLTWDWVALVPADTAVMHATFSGDHSALDGPSDRIYGLNAAPFTALTYEQPVGASRTSAIPNLYPNVANRWYLLDRDTSGVAAQADVIVHYWPRYLYIRPVVS